MGKIEARLVVEVVGFWRLSDSGPFVIFVLVLVFIGLGLGANALSGYCML